MNNFVVGLLLLASAAGVWAADDPEELFQRANGTFGDARNLDSNLALLRRANAIWDAAHSSSPDFASSLDMEAVLLLNRELQSGGGGLAAWRREAGPLTSHALSIANSIPDIKPGRLALALELQARTVGTELERSQLLQRALALRQRSVDQLPLNETPWLSLTPSGPAPLRIGGVVSAPVLVSRAEPQYTAEARLGGIIGAVKLSLVVDRSGMPRDFRLIESLGFGLDEEAVKAVSGWRFKPAEKDGQPVAVMAQVQVNFRLLDEAAH